jgi:hypothetical protein
MSRFISNTNTNTNTKTVDDDGFKVVGRAATQRESKTCFLTINSKKEAYCIKWITRCGAPMDMKDQLNCFQCDKKHHKFPICFKFMQGKCAAGSDCKYPHPIEFEDASFRAKFIVQRQVAPVVQSQGGGAAAPVHLQRIKTMICIPWLCGQFNGESLALLEPQGKAGQQGCNFGSNCGSAHSLSGVSQIQTLQLFEDRLKNGKINFDAIFAELKSVITNNHHHMAGCLNALGKPTWTKPILEPFNLNAMIAYWAAGAGAARKLQYSQNQKDVDPVALFERIESEGETNVWMLNRLVGSCQTDRQLCIKIKIAQVIGKNPDIKPDEVCKHLRSCKNGPHFLGHDDGQIEGICLGGIIGPCKCLSFEAVQKKRADLQLQLDQLGKEYKKNPTKQIKDAIDRLATTFVDTVRRRHLTELGYKSIGFKAEESFTMDSFCDLPAASEMTDEQRAEYLLRVEEREKKIQKAKEEAALLAKEKAEKEEAEKAKLLSEIDDTCPIQVDWVQKDAFKFMSLSEYTKDCQTKGDANGMYNFWHQYFQSKMSFEGFREYFFNKLLEWNTMDIETVDVTCINSSYKDDEPAQLEDRVKISPIKMQFACFKSWFRDIPINEDETIVGDLSELAITASTLFEKYLEENRSKGFSDSFPSWLNKNPIDSQIVEVFRETKDYFAAQKYVTLNVASTGMTVQEYLQYDPTNVTLWMKVNHERKILNQEPISIDECIANKEILSEYYFRGWYSLCTIEQFMQEKQDGWKHTHSGARNCASDNPVLAAKIAAAQAKQQAALDAYLSSNLLVSNIPSEQKPKSKKKIVRRKVTKEESEDESDVESVNDEFEFGMSFDPMKMMNDNSNSKKLPLVTSMALPEGKTHYMHLVKYSEEREQKNVSGYNLHVGPFSSEKIAKKALKEIIKAKSSAGVACLPKIEKNEGNVGTSSDSWDIFWINLCSIDNSNKRPFSWLVKFYVSQCVPKGLFHDCDIKTLFTDIPSLTTSIEEYIRESSQQAKPIETSSKPVCLKLDKKKNSRQSADEIKARLEEKKKEKEIQKEVKLARKIIVTEPDAQPVISTKKSKTIGRVYMVSDSTLLSDEDLVEVE